MSKAKKSDGAKQQGGGSQTQSAQGQKNSGKAGQQNTRPGSNSAPSNPVNTKGKRP